MEKTYKKGSEQTEKLHKYISCQKKLKKNIEELECRKSQKKSQPGGGGGGGGLTRKNFGR